MKRFVVENGVILVRKEKGISSLDFLNSIRNATGAKKIGHSGILDPNASGIMIVLLDDKTKMADKFRDMKKEYIGTIEFHNSFKKDLVKSLFLDMEGKSVVQIPPKRSAVARKPRKKKIYSLDIISLNDRLLRFRIVCEAGFYVRTFAVYIGKKLGIGAHLKDLERTKIGKFDIKDAATIKELEKII